MKPHISTAPPFVHAQYARALADCEWPGEGGRGGIAVPALGLVNAMRRARQLGYDCDRPSMPAHDRLRELDAAGDKLGLANHRVAQGAELRWEAVALREWENARKWAAGPSLAEAAAASVAAREAREHEARVASAVAARIEAARAERDRAHHASVRAEVEAELRAAEHAQPAARTASRKGRPAASTTPDNPNDPQPPRAA